MVNTQEKLVIVGLSVVQVNIFHQSKLKLLKLVELFHLIRMRVSMFEISVLVKFVKLKEKPIFLKHMNNFGKNSFQKMLKHLYQEHNLVNLMSHLKLIGMVILSMTKAQSVLKEIEKELFLSVLHTIQQYNFMISNLRSKELYLDLILLCLDLMNSLLFLNLVVVNPNVRMLFKLYNFPLDQIL